MNSSIKLFTRNILRIFAILLVLNILLRLVRRLYKFPTPAFITRLIDNPVRRRFQRPMDTVVLFGVNPGMAVLEVGPGKGTYTLAAARRVGSDGKVVAVDIQPEVIASIERRAEEEGIANVEARLADVYSLPYADDFFDAVYLSMVIGEIPDPDRATREFYRVLRPGGALAFAEFIVDPDYPLPRTLIRLASRAGFRMKRMTGNLLAYTLVFEKA